MMDGHDLKKFIELDNELTKLRQENHQLKTLVGDYRELMQYWKDRASETIINEHSISPDGDGQRRE